MSKAIKSLADGQLAASKGTLYTAPTSKQAVISTIRLVNTSDSALKVNLYFKASGGTSRRLLPKDMELGAGYSAVLNDEITLEAADILEGDATIASAVDYIISGVENS